MTILRGEETETVLGYGHQKLPTFGVGSDLNRNEWRSVFRQLYALGLISNDPEANGRWLATEKGVAAVKGEIEVQLRKEDPAPPQKKADRGRARLAEPEDEADNALYHALKKKRIELAKENNAPAYVIFTDRSLLDIARRHPTTLEDLADCHGIGEAKLKRFGKVVLEIVKKTAA